MGRGPYRVGDFVGQGRVLKPLLRILRGAQARGEPMTPLLLIGDSGTGKTLAARTLAAEMGVSLYSFHGPTTADAVIGKLVQMKHGDFLLFDEAHQLSEKVKELLYVVLDAVRMAVADGARAAVLHHGSGV